MKLVAEYLLDAIKFEQMAEDAKDAALKAAFMKQAADYRKLALTAPANVELELSIYDNGQYHALVFPCQRDGLGWLDVQANRYFSFEPTHWRLWTKSST